MKKAQIKRACLHWLWQRSSRSACLATAAVQSLPLPVLTRVCPVTSPALPRASAATFPSPLTLTDGAITGCTAEGKDETQGVGSEAIAKMPGEIAESGSIAVDGVSGATVTSTAIKGGCCSCSDRCRPEPR